MHYNTICACDQTIDTEAACSLSEDILLPWEGDGKLSVFQQSFLGAYRDFPIWLGDFDKLH